MIILNQFSPQSVAPTTTQAPTTTPLCGALLVNGFYPLFDSSICAELAGSGTYHSHVLNGQRYYMPNGVEQFFGDYVTTTQAPTTTLEVTTTQAPTYADSEAFAGYDLNTYFIRDEELWAMGQNDVGALGNYSEASLIQAPTYMGSDQVEFVAGNRDRIFIIKTDGTVLAMGVNTNGELGDGTSDDQFSFVEIFGDTTTQAPTTQAPTTQAPTTQAPTTSTTSTTTEEPTTAWDPSESSDIALWLDASDTSTITHSSNAVSQWSDKSGNGNHATQTNSSFKPTYTANGMSGDPALDFDSADPNKLSIPSIDMEGKSLLVVLQHDTGGINQQILSHDSVNVQLRINTSNEIEYASANPAMYTNGTGSTATIPTNQIQLIGFSFDGTLTFTINGAFENSGVSKSTGGNSVFNLIGVRSNHYTPFDGKIGEYIILDSVSSTERQKVEGYLAHKWGLEGNLPSSHPYKSSAPQA
jgi:hypothetical protein